MRTLKYAILGLLRREAMTGYDISRAFEAGLGNFWHASHSQIYPELKKLTDEGLIVFDTVILGERLEKKLYTITPQGLADFQAWILQDEPLPPTPKDPFRLRVYLSDALSDEELMLHFRNHLRQVQRRLEMYEGNMQRGFGPVPSPAGMSKAERGDYMVLRSAIMRDRMTVQWLHDCMDMLVHSGEVSAGF